MNWKSYMPLILAVVLGLVAAKVARDSMMRNRAAAAGPVRSTKVVVAQMNIAPGQELTADLLTLGLIAADVPPPNTSTDPAALIGRVAATPMFTGQPVLEDLLVVRGAASGLQALVPRGMRAITVEVNETSALAGMLLPGCRVDVVSTITGTDKGGAVACTIVQDVLVQAVGQRLTPAKPDAGNDKADDGLFRTVTLIATPRDAEAIELASAGGRTRLVLRGTGDRALSESDGVSFVDLRGKTAAAVYEPAPAPQPVTQPAPPPAPVSADPFVEAAPPENAPPSRPRRTVTLLKAGVRSEVVFETDTAEPETALTGVDESPVHE